MLGSRNPRETLLSYLRVQKDLDRRLYALMQQAVSDVDRQLRGIVGDGVGARVRRDQLLMVKRVTLERLADVMTKTGYLVQAGRYQAAAASVKDFLAYEDVLFRALPSADRVLVDRYKESAIRTAANGLEAAEQRLLGTSYRPLSQAVYDTTQLASGQVDRVVDSALVRGLSAVELAKEVRSFISPTVPGGLPYAALRLGRTEINNAFHAKAAQEARDSPFVDGVVWHLSGSHPRPDECNDYAANDAGEGYPQGFFTPDDVPSKPHPNCLCYITPEVVDTADFLDNFFAGRYDGFLKGVVYTD